MIEAAGLLKAYGHRLKEVHMSEVASNSKREAMTLTAGQPVLAIRSATLGRYSAGLEALRQANC
jgi:hypothetical protein